jgi:hypothetical protein
MKKVLLDSSFADIFVMDFLRFRGCPFGDTKENV